MGRHRALTYGAAAPFLVAACLFALMLLAPLTGMAGPSSNVYFTVGALAIVLGWLAGIGSLIAMRGVRIWLRTLIGLAYLPIIVLSLLSVGA